VTTIPEFPEPKNLQDLVDTVKELETYATKKSDEAKKLLSDLENWSMQLLRERNSLQTSLGDCEIKLKSSTSSFEKLTAEHSNLQEKLSATQKENLDQITHFQNKVSELERTIESKTKRIDTQSQRITTLAQTLASSEQNLENSQKVIAQLEKALNDKKIELEAVREQVPNQGKGSFPISSSDNLGPLERSDSVKSFNSAASATSLISPRHPDKRSRRYSDGQKPAPSELNSAGENALRKLQSLHKELSTMVEQNPATEDTYTSSLTNLEENAKKLSNVYQSSHKRVTSLLKDSQSFDTKLDSLRQSIMRLSEDVIENCRDVSEPTKLLSKWLSNHSKTMRMQIDGLESKVKEEFDNSSSSLSTVHELIQSMIPQLKEIQDKISSFENFPLRNLIELEHTMPKLNEISSKNTDLARLALEECKIKTQTMHDINQLMTPIAEAMDKISFKERDIKEDETPSLEETVKDVEETMNKVGPNEQNLRVTLARKQALIDQLQNKLTEEEERKVKTLNLLRSSKKQILKLEKDTLDLSNANKELQSQLSTAESQLSKEQKDTEMLSSKIAALSKELASVEKRSKELEQNLQIEKSEVSRLQHQLQQAKSSDEALRKELQSKKDEETIRDDISKSFNESIMLLENNIANLKVQLQTSQELHLQKSKDFDDLNARFNSLQDQLLQKETKYNDDYEKYKQLLQRTMKDLKLSKQMHSECKKDYDVKILELQKLEEEKQQQQQELVENKSTCERLRTEIEEYHSQLDELLGVKLLFEKEQV
jgi:chromosome segregation ATPase